MWIYYFFTGKYSAIFPLTRSSLERDRIFLLETISPWFWCCPDPPDPPPPLPLPPELEAPEGPELEWNGIKNTIICENSQRVVKRAFLIDWGALYKERRLNDLKEETSTSTKTFLFGTGFCFDAKSMRTAFDIKSLFLPFLQSTQFFCQGRLRSFGKEVFTLPKPWFPTKLSLGAIIFPPPRLKPCGKRR